MTNEVTEVFLAGEPVKITASDVQDMLDCLIQWGLSTQADADPEDFMKAFLARNAIVDRLLTRQEDALFNTAAKAASYLT